MKRTFIKMLSVVMALMMVAGTLATVVSAANCEHHYVETVVAATCAKDGYTVDKCEHCGDEINHRDSVAKLEECLESTLVELPESAADCDDPAYEKGKKCTVCGREYHGAVVEGSAALGHTWEIVIVEPTCDVKGEIARVCKREGCEAKVVLEVLDETGRNSAGVTCDTSTHIYEYVITVAPTCVSKGSAVYRCVKCNDYRAEDIYGVAFGHTWGPRLGEGPTCTTEGTYHRICAVCGEKDSNYYAQENKKLGHDYKNITSVHDCVFKVNNDEDYNNDVVKFNESATCYQAGYQWQHCTRCDDLKKTTTNEKSHNYNKTETKTTGTGCSMTTVVYNVCSYCGHKAVKSTTTEAHNWAKSGSALVYNVYDVTGNKVATKKTEAQVASTVKKNCTTSFNFFKVCSDCGYELLEKTIEADGHDWNARDQWTYKQYTGSLAACDPAAASYYVRTCTTCGITENVCYQNAPHNYSVYSCTEGCDDGKCYDCTHAGRKLVCNMCYEETGDVVTKTAHTLNKGNKVSDADCNSKAVYQFSCSTLGCKHKENQEVGDVNPAIHDKALFHIIEESPATCLTDGKQYGICRGCGDSTNEITQIIPKLGHTTKANGTVTKAAVEATCMSFGMTAEIKCGNGCGLVLQEAVQTPFNEGNHVGAKTELYVTLPTCMHGKLTWYRWSECEHVASVESGSINKNNHGDYDHVLNETTGVYDETFTSALEVIAYNAATCTEDGNIGYTHCTLCDTVTDVAINDCKYEGHTTSNHNTIVNNTKGKKLADVAAKLVLTKYGHAYTTLVSARVEETCTVDGKEALYECRRCGKDCEADGKNGAKIDAHGDKYIITVEDKAPDCDETGTIGGKYCPECAHITDAAQCAGCKGNSYTIPANGHKIVVHETVDAACLTDGYVMYKCENCDQKTLENGEFIASGSSYKNGSTTYLWYFTYTLATGHDFDAEVTAPATCTTAETTTKTCKDCNYVETVKVEGEALGHKNGDAVLDISCKTGDGTVACTVCRMTVEHNWIEVTNKATCEADGAIFKLCKDCNAKEGEVALPKIGHKYHHTVSYTEATSEKAGAWVWNCANCGEDQTTVLEFRYELTFDVEINPYTENKTATKLDFVNGGLVEVTVFVTAENVDISVLDYKLAYNNKLFTLVNAEIVYDGFEIPTVNATSTTVNLLAAPKVGTNVVKITGENVPFIKYIFKLSEGATMIDKSDIILLNPVVRAIADIAIVNNQLTDNIKVALMGDLDKDSDVDVDDYIAFRAVANANAYDIAADFDNNGAVDFDDLIAINNFLVSDRTVADYYTMLGVDIAKAIAGYEFDDYNADGVVNLLDAAAFADAFETILDTDADYIELLGKDNVAGLLAAANAKASVSVRV